MKTAKSNFGRALLSVKFLLAASVLFLAAAGLRPTVAMLANYYHKEPAELRRSLKEFDVSCLPTFRSGWKYSWIDAPVEDIATNEYKHMVFTKSEFGKDSMRVELFVTYYNNPKDKVPHTPEVCSRQAGIIVEKLSTIMLDVPQLAEHYPRIKARLLFLKGPGHNTVDIYVFCVEGQFKYSREQVRWVLAKPGNHFTYFSKIEAAASYPMYDDPSATLEICKQLIYEALPALLAEYFPTAEQLKRR